MASRVLPFDPRVVPQERYWDCGPAAAQIVLNSLGIHVSEDVLIREIGTTTRGTDFVGLIERYLDRRLPHANYTSVDMQRDPPTQGQKDALWRNLTQSINAGYGVVVNWVSPPGNRPRAIKGTQQPNYGSNTVWHYVAAMGWSDDDGQKAAFIADSGFAPFTGYWVPFDGPGSLCSLIPPKAYCYANVVTAEKKQEPAAPPVPRAAKRDSHALAIINEGRRARSGEGRFDHPVMTDRGIVIALATALVESDLLMYANYSDPESLSFPHDAVGSDHNSSGLFQQRAPWWGTAADRMDAARSAAMFYNALSKLPYNETSKTPGFYAQAVQRSAFPSRYDEKYQQASEIFNRLQGNKSDGDVMVEVPKEQWDALYRAVTNRLPSRSPLRRLGEGEIDTWSGMDLNVDANLHVLLVKSLAEMGDRNALGLLSEVAGADLVKYPERSADASLARRILAHIESTNPSVLTEFLKGA
jgi:hypothetical protein